MCGASRKSSGCSTQPERKRRKLKSDQTVKRLKVFAGVTGMVLLILGVICMPIGYGVSPKRDQSAFYNLADMSAFLLWGSVLAGFGLILLVVAFTLPARFDAEVSRPPL
jgi:hypothetical protein